MSTNPLVSVIIPVYNVAPYLRQCLDSICNQTLKDIEIILVDDGSTDESPAILQEYADTDARITLLHQQNQYAGVARNNGMNIARGKYLSFLDADDYFDLDMLRCLTQTAEIHEVDMVLCGADVYREAENRIAPAPWLFRTNLLQDADLNCFSPLEVLGDKLYEVVKLAPWNKLFRADFVRRNQLVWSDASRANDVFFVGSALATAKTMAAVPKPLIHYRIRQHSISHSKDKSTSAQVKEFSALYSNLVKFNVDKKYMHSFNLCYMASLIWDCDTLDIQQARRFRKQIIEEIEPTCNLLSKPGYENASRVPLIEYRYKSMISPLTTVVCIEDEAFSAAEWEERLTTITGVKEADFDILCICQSADSGAGPVFKKLENKDIRCQVLTGCITSLRSELPRYSASQYKIEVTPEDDFSPESFKKTMHKLENSSIAAGIYSYKQISRAASNIPKVSIIVPVYSGKEYFVEMIDRLRNQTLKDIEIIFVDDRGPDGSFSLAELAAKEDSRIVLLRNEKNMGPGPSRNRGIEKATGEFVAFVDADDLIPEDYYEKLYTKAKDTGALVVKCGRANLYADGRITYSSHLKDIETKLKKGVHLVNAFEREHTTAIYQRAHVLECGARNSDARQDEDTTFIMMALYKLSASKYAPVEGVYYYYRTREESITQQLGDDYLPESIKSMQDKLDFIVRHKSLPQMQVYASNLIDRRLIWRYKNTLTASKITQSQRKEYIHEVLKLADEYRTKGLTYKLHGMANELVSASISVNEYVCKVYKNERKKLPLMVRVRQLMSILCDRISGN